MEKKHNGISVLNMKNDEEIIIAASLTSKNGFVTSIYGALTMRILSIPWFGVIRNQLFMPAIWIWYLKLVIHRFSYDLAPESAV